MNEDLAISSQTKTKLSPFLKYLTFSILIIIACSISIWFGLLQFRMPEVVSDKAGTELFSAERAKDYLEEIAQKPRPVGASEHDRVRDYLVAQFLDLGLSPEILISEEAEAALGHEGVIENILAKIPGKDSTGTIMLTSHYDTDANSPGAGDAGSGVAAILETVRALGESPSLKNDVIIYISDGEEIGLLGAKAFVSNHPWAKEVDIVINLEARGSSGPSVLFETNEQNERLVAEFAKATSNPIAHSFVYDLYKAMPNDTDLSVYKSAGMYGLNFGFFDGSYSYHSPEDTVENLNLESLQHHGDNMLNLVQHLGNMDLIAKEDEKSLYFNVIGKKVISYNEKYVLPIMIIGIILFFATFFHGYVQKKLTSVGTSIGFLLFLSTIIIGYFAGEGILAVISYLTEIQIWTISAYPSISNPVFIGTILLVMALIVAIYLATMKKISTNDMAMGGLIGWLILVCISSFFFKNSSYVFIWPLLIGLVGFNLLLLVKKKLLSVEGVVSLLLGMLPLVMIAPIIYLAYILLLLHASGILMAGVALAVVFLVPALGHIRKRYVWLLPSLLTIFGLFILLGSYIFLQ